MPQREVEATRAATTPRPAAIGGSEGEPSRQAVRVYRVVIIKNGEFVTRAIDRPEERAAAG